jgi:hypothetical protein
MLLTVTPGHPGKNNFEPALNFIVKTGSQQLTYSKISPKKSPARDCFVFCIGLPALFDTACYTKKDEKNCIVPCCPAVNRTGYGPGFQ